ncbi:major facilitator superfamily domain-containing protein [Leptodontidium sp. 2 PMI_412]|nr:major facilitator superfamily domain-containing protein [Leptodontidium sp. 2 PMI_412]
MGASVYSPGMESFMDEHGVHHAYASLGLALYVLGYGSGALVFAPLSEIPTIGRAIPYPLSFVVFILATVGSALTRYPAAFMFLRFIQGVFSSPALCTGGASISDVFAADVLPHAMTIWVISCQAAPAVGPIIAAFAVPVLEYRFTMWDLVIAATPVLVLLCLLPETNPDTILIQRATRIRKLQDDMSYKYWREITVQRHTTSDMLRESITTPLKITFLDPAMLFINVYSSLIYGIYYSFFEVIPLVYQDMYGFSLGKMGLAFLPIMIGALLGAVVYNVYIHKVFKPRLRGGTPVEHEEILLPALWACFLPPISLFTFGWTSRADIHWTIPTIGMLLFPFSVFFILLCGFVYVAHTHPQYVSSVFAAQDFTRCAFATGTVVFARVMYLKLRIGGGCSLLSGLMTLCIGGMLFLYHYGRWMRERSTFKSKW